MRSTYHTFLIKNLLLIAIVFLLSASANAGMIIDVLDTTLTRGGTGTVDVMIKYDNTGSNLLSSYGLVLQISQIGGTTNELQFVDPQSNSQAASPSYLLFGDSLGITSSISSVNWTSDNYFGTDTTNSAGVIVPSTGVLLARLDLNTSLASGGDTFLISLVPSDSSYTDEGLVAALAFSDASHSGLVTLSAVPEPSSLALAAVGLGLLGCLHARKRVRI